MFNNIPISRLLAYIVIAGSLPIFFVLMLLYNKQSKLSELESRLNYVHEQAFLKEKKQAVNIAIRNHYRDAEHFYTDKNLESIQLLKPEIEALQKLVNNKNFAGDEKVRSRLDFLQGKENKLLFSEGSVVSYPLFQESIASLVHPVEVDVEDVKELLAKIEGVDIEDHKPGVDRPQLIITDFKIDKKNISESNQVFVLNLKFLKREYL